MVGYSSKGDIFRLRLKIIVILLRFFLKLDKFEIVTNFFNINET